jgi:hypothetical protein
MSGRLAIVGSAVLSVVLATPAASWAQSDTLGSVRLSTQVSANGQPLAPGTYTLRLSSEPVTPVIGQGPQSERWIEFLQGGQVKGKELASVVAPADVKAVAKRTPPAAGRPLVQTLRGNDYVRVWVNSAGTQYLLHLTR